MNDLIQCPLCKAEYETQPDKCKKCAYPFSGTDKEKSHFVAHQIIKKGKISNTKDSIKMTRRLLFFIAANYIVIIPLIYFKHLDTTFIGINVFIGLIFLFFGIATKIRPFLSILIPLIILILFYTLTAIISLGNLWNGIAWKIVFLVSMIYSLISIIRAKKIKKESEFLESNDHK